MRGGGGVVEFADLEAPAGSRRGGDDLLQGPGFGVYGLWFMVYGLGFRV